jgi:hypothetical protein
MRILYLHNEYHLGDNVFNIILLSNIIKEYLIENNIKIYYFCQDYYIYQVKEFNNCENVIIRPINEKPNNSLQLWLNNQTINFTMDRVHSEHIKRGMQRIFYDIYYCRFFNHFFKLCKINIKLFKFYYKDKDLKSRYKNIINNYQSKYKNIQLLILNSQPFSEQYKYDKSEWDKRIRELNKKYKIITTTKVDGVNCTMDDKFTIKDIAALSINVPIIIAVNSGVVPGLLNKYTLNNVKQFYIFDDRCRYSYPKFQNKEKIYDINFEELDKYIF